MTDESPWDQDAADRLDGSLVLIGLTYDEPSGYRREQFFGTVTEVDEQAGVTIALSGSRAGETFQLPSDLASFKPAKPGSYQLQSTGEVVDDPDFTTNWMVKRKPN